MQARRQGARRATHIGLTQLLPNYSQPPAHVPGAPSLTPFPSPEHLPRTFNPLTRARRSSFLSLESEAEPGREMFCDYWAWGQSLVWGSSWRQSRHPNSMAPPSTALIPELCWATFLQARHSIGF